MAVKLRLMRMGKKKQPTYRIVAADSRSPRDGRFIENIGKYHPLEDPSLIEVNSDRAQYWLSVGAQPSEPVQRGAEQAHRADQHTDVWNHLEATMALTAAGTPGPRRMLYRAARTWRATLGRRSASAETRCSLASPTTTGPST